MRIKVATKWSELNDWQLQKLCVLLFRDTSDMLPLLEGLFCKGGGFWYRVRFARLLKQVAVSDLLPYADFLFKTPDLYRFPDLRKWGVEAPDDRLSNVCIKQFSVADAVFFKWYANRGRLSVAEEEVLLRQLVASLYVVDSFDALRLRDVADRTDKISIDLAYVVALAYWSVRGYIVSCFPVVFPRKKADKELEDKPVFKKTDGYVPFSKVIMALAIDDRQPLGALKDCGATNLYDFFGVLTERLLLDNKD